MKKSLIALMIVCCSTAFANAQECFCTRTVLNRDLSGKATARIGFNSVLLANNQGISPEVNSPVVFALNDLAISREATCQLEARISIYDDLERREVYTLTTSSRPEFTFVFPNSDRTYSVQISNTYRMPHNPDIDPGLMAIVQGRCVQSINFKVRPTPRRCDCVIENGINTLVVYGGVSYKGEVLGQKNYDLRLYIVNKSGCNLAIESMGLSNGVVAPKITISPRGDTVPYEATISPSKWPSIITEGKTQMVNIVVRYSFNGYPACSQSFLAQYSDLTKK